EQLNRHSNFELIGGRAPDLSLVTYRYKPAGISDAEADRLNACLMERVNRGGKLYMSSTRLLRGGGERLYLRVAVMSFRSQFRHVRNAVEVITEAARSLS